MGTHNFFSSPQHLFLLTRIQKVWILNRSVINDCFKRLIAQSTLHHQNKIFLIVGVANNQIEEITIKK